MYEDCNPTPEATPEAPESLPCINLKLLRPGTKLLLEGETDIYEVDVQYPGHGVVAISANLLGLREPTVGQFLFSEQPSGVRANVIQRGWAMRLRFRNGEFVTQYILAATVRGTREDGSHWSYDVF